MSLTREDWKDFKLRAEARIKEMDKATELDNLMIELAEKELKKFPPEKKKDDGNKL